MSARLRKLGLLTSLYVAQGLPYGFFVQVLPVLLLERGRSLPEVGLANLLALPWAAKFLVGPVADRISAPRFGRRRAMIIPLQLTAAAMMVVLAALDLSQGVFWLLAGVLVVNALSAMQDVATDGLAVELLDDKERGIGNGLQVAGYRVGMILGGGLLLVLVSRLEWAGTFGAMGMLLVVTTIPVLLHRERTPAAAHARPKVAWLEELTGWLKQPGALGWLGALLLYKFGEAAAQGMLRPLLIQRGYDEAALGWVLGGVGFTTGLLGALAGGALVLRFTLRRGLVLFATLQAVAVLGYVVAARQTTLEVVVITAGLEHFTSGMATAALFTRMMEACRPDRAATDYTLQACAVVVATGAASALSGFSAQALGFSGHFLVAFAFAVLAALYVARHRFTLFRQEGAP